MSFRVPEAARVTIGVMRSDASAGNNGAFDVESQHFYRPKGDM